MNSRFLTYRISALALVLATGPALLAQATTGSLSGSVRDKKGTPIVGARVSLNSPALFAPRVVLSDANGEWRAPMLAVGNYDITVSKDGYVGSKSQGVRVGLGSGNRIDLTVKPVAQAGATVEVVASSAASVDKADTKSGTNVSAEVLATIPATDRSFAGAADLAPGLVAGSGGSYSIRGGATGNTQYRVNGTDVKDDYQGDLTGTFVIEDNVEDMQVVLSNLNARYGRATGGAINVVTKTGGNDFHGSIRADLSRNSWAGFQPGNVLYTPDGEKQVDDNLQRKYQVTASGPIVKDRVWFSLGTILTPESTHNYSLGQPYGTLANGVVQSQDDNVNAVLNAGPSGYSWSALDVSAPYIRKDKSSYYEGKITGSISADHTVDFSFSKEKTDLYNRNPYGDTSASIGRLAVLGHQKDESSVYGIGYRGVLASDTFLEARYNRLDSSTYFPQGDTNFGQGELMIVYAGQVGSGYGGVRRGLSYPFGLGQPPHPDRRGNRSGNVNLKMYRDLGGNHEIDLGVDYYEGRRETATQAGIPNEAFRVGGIYASNSAANDYLFPTEVWQGYGSAYAQDITGLRGIAPTVQKFTSRDGLTKNQMISFYANDEWTINQHWNLMLGLRSDTNKVIDTTGERLANTTSLSPRLKLTYDLLGDSKHVFSFTAARLNGDFTTGFTDAFITQGSSNFLAYGWKGDGTQPLPGATDALGLAGVRFVNYNALTNLSNYDMTQPINASDIRTKYTIDPKLSAPVLEELTLGYRRTYGNGSFVGLTAVHRQWKKEWAFQTDYLPGTQRKVGTTDVYIMPWYVFNSDKLKREYNSLEMEWNSRISSIWNMGGSWTFSRLTGNQDGGDAYDTTFRDNAAPSYYDNRIAKTKLGLTDSEISPNGPLYNHVGNRIRLHVEATLPLGKGKISYAALLRYASGSPYSQVVNDPYPAGTFTSLATPSERAPGQYTAFVNGRGQYETNNTYGLDFKINFQVPLGISRMMLIGDVTVVNLMNHTITSGLERTMWSDAKYTLDPYSNAGYIYTVKNRSTIINDGNVFNSTNTTNQAGDLRGDINFFSSPRSVAMSLGLKF